MSYRKLTLEDLEERTLLAGELLVSQAPSTHATRSSSSFMDRNIYQIVVTPSRSVIDIMERVQFSAVAVNRNGIPLINQPRLIRWEVQNRAQGTINQEGLFTAFTRTGTAVVRVVDETGRTGHGSVRVTTKTISITPNNTNLMTGDQFQFHAVLLEANGTPALEQPRFSWHATGGTIDSNGNLTATWSGEGTRTFNVTAIHNRWKGSIQYTIEAPRLSDIHLTPYDTVVEIGQARQFSAVGLDQRGNPLASQPQWIWRATGGEVSGVGLFVAGQNIGDFEVSVSAGSLRNSVPVNIQESGPEFNNQDFEDRVDSFFTDYEISRQEMIEAIRFIGEDDGMVDSSEFLDIRLFVTSSFYVMPDHVRGLAMNLTHENPANLRFLGETLGNLVAGTTLSRLNKLIDKWFFGADLPVLVGSNVTYMKSAGVLYNGALNLNQARQGNIGNCYFVAAVLAISQENPEKIKSAIIDNGDETYTISFRYLNAQGVRIADYLTVNEMLPMRSNGDLVYGGIGQNGLSENAVIWFALLEKAYAQWNETGRAGRNGTNTYSGIEGGWMHNVNAQILGYNSTNFSFSSSTKQQFLNELAAGKAVTVGTKSSVAGGWVSGHAYVVESYNPATDTFKLINPWGFNHLDVTWEQIRTNCTIFTSTFVS